MFSDGDLSRVINKDKINLKPLVNELYIEHGFADVIKTPGINPTMEDYYFSKGKREMTLLFQVCDTAGFNFRANIDKLYGQPDKLNPEAYHGVSLTCIRAEYFVKANHGPFWQDNFYNNKLLYSIFHKFT